MNDWLIAKEAAAYAKTNVEAMLPRREAQEAEGRADQWTAAPPLSGCVD
jgi:hypothetical protein